MFNPFTYFKKEDKPVFAADLNVTELVKYIHSKSAYKTALEVGKYNLALFLKEDIESSEVKDKPINYIDLQRNLYVAYKVNEYLEQPEAFHLFTEINQCVFLDRYTMQQLVEESKALELAKYSKGEMKRLFEYFKTKYELISLPTKLPDYIKSGSGYRFGSYNLHRVIKNLFEQSQEKIVEWELTKKM